MKFRDGPAAVIDVIGLTSVFPVNGVAIAYSARQESLGVTPLSWRFTLLAIA